MRDKKLGMSLNTLLSASGMPPPKGNVPGTDELVQLFDEALACEERGNCLEAYHQYRRIMEQAQTIDCNRKEVSNCVSRACNNAAALLADTGILNEAEEFLLTALNFWPGNTTAAANLKIIRGCDKEDAPQ